MSFLARSIRFLSKQKRKLSSEIRKLSIRLQYPNCKFEKFVFVGRGVTIKVTDGATATIGRRTTISDNSVIVVKGGDFSIGNNSFVGWGAVICANQSISIGHHALIAEYVTIRDQNHGVEISQGNFAEQPMDTAPITIGNNVWLGAKSSVLAGVSIADNCVVAAHAVVTRSVDEASVVGGVPAKLIRRIESS